MNQKVQFQKIERSLRLRVARDVCIALSLLFVCARIFIAPGFGVVNPKNWSNLFIAMTADGFFSQYAVFFVGAALICAALAALFEFLRRRNRVS